MEQYVKPTTAILIPVSWCYINIDYITTETSMRGTHKNS